MSDGLVPFEKLAEYSKRKRPADVVRWLNDRGIQWITDGKGRPCTTVTQIDRAMDGGNVEEFEFYGQEAI